MADLELIAAIAFSAWIVTIVVVGYFVVKANNEMNEKEHGKN